MIAFLSRGFGAKRLGLASRERPILGGKYLVAGSPSFSVINHGVALRCPQRLLA
jgi:hypothetical protein